MIEYSDTPFSDEEVSAQVMPEPAESTGQELQQLADQAPDLALEKLQSLDTMDQPDPIVEEVGPEQEAQVRKQLDMLTFLEGLKSEQAVQQAEKNIGHQSTLNNQPVNPFPIIRDEGYTMIHPDDFNLAVMAIKQAFPSLSETGMLLDPADRVFMAQSVMNNKQLRSDVKSKLVNEMMRTGTIDPEALGPEWYKLRGISLQPHPSQMGGM